MTRTERKHITEPISTRIHNEGRNYLFVLVDENGNVEKNDNGRPRIYQTLEQARKQINGYRWRYRQGKWCVAVYQIEDVVTIEEFLEDKGE